MSQFMKITADPDFIDIDFRDLAVDPNVDIPRWIMGRGFVEWAQKNNVGGVTICMKSGRKFDVCCTAQMIAKHLPIDDINGTVLFADNNALLEKIKTDVLIKLY